FCDSVSGLSWESEQLEWRSVWPSNAAAPTPPARSRTSTRIAIARRLWLRCRRRRRRRCMAVRSNRSSGALPPGMPLADTRTGRRLLSGEDVAAEPSPKRRSWSKIAVLVVAVVVGAGVAIGIAVTSGSGGGSSAQAAPPDPGTTWAAGVRRAPDFTLRD